MKHTHVVKCISGGKIQFHDFSMNAKGPKWLCNRAFANLNSKITQGLNRASLWAGLVSVRWWQDTVVLTLLLLSACHFQGNRKVLNAFINWLLIYMFLWLIGFIAFFFLSVSVLTPCVPLCHLYSPGTCIFFFFFFLIVCCSTLAWSLISWYVGPVVFFDSVIRALKIEGPQRPAVSAASRPDMKFRGAITMSRSRNRGIW